MKSNTKAVTAIGIIGLVALAAGVYFNVIKLDEPKDKTPALPPLDKNASYPDLDNDHVSDDNTIRITILWPGTPIPTPEQNIHASISGDNFTSATVYFKGTMPTNVKELVAETDENGNWGSEIEPAEWVLEITADPGTEFNENTKISISTTYKSHWTISGPLTLRRRQDNFEIRISDPQYVSLATYKIAIKISVDNYSISHIDNFDLINIGGAEQIYVAYHPLLPKVENTIVLLKDSSDIELVMVENTVEFIGYYNIPCVEPLTYEEDGTGMLPCDNLSGLYPTPSYWFYESDLDTYKNVKVSSALVRYNTPTGETFIVKYAKLELTYKLEFTLQT